MSELDTKDWDYLEKIDHLLHEFEITAGEIYRIRKESNGGYILYKRPVTEALQIKAEVAKALEYRKRAKRAQYMTISCQCSSRCDHRV